MNKVIFSILLFLCKCSFGQYVQLRYDGVNHEIRKAVAKANEILVSREFDDSLKAISSFDNTAFTGLQISEKMKELCVLRVTEYYKKCTMTTAKTMVEIKINTAKLNGDLPSVTNTLVHETINGIDWLNQKWDFTHWTHKVENLPISAPYVIGQLAERFAST